MTAERLGEWLSGLQEPSGGFIERDLRPDTKPVVFNTGQILHGFNALILRRGRQDLVPHARRAGDFLVSSADETGSFVRNEHYDMVHSYNVRSAWALLTLVGCSAKRRMKGLRSPMPTGRWRNKSTTVSS